MTRKLAKKKPYMPVKAKSTEWGTPDSIFVPLDEEFHFTLDAAATLENAKCRFYYNKSQDGSIQDWSGQTVWLNPPYNVPSLSDFTDKVIEETDRGVTTVMLVPVKTDQLWWHKLWSLYLDFGNIEYRWIKGRVKFVGAEHSAPFPSVIIIVRGF